MPKFILSKVEGIKTYSKKLFLKLFIFLAVCGLGVFAFSSAAQAATYYVCNVAGTGTGCNASSSGWSTGNDSNTTTQAQSKATPWKTIQKCADNVAAGDTCIVGDGTYADVHNCSGYLCVVRMDTNGTSGKWITFKAENQWGAVIDGNNDTALFGIIISANYIRLEDFEITQNYWDGIFANEVLSYAYIKGNKIHHNGNVTDLTCQTKINCSGHSGVSQGADAQYYTYDSNIIYSNGRNPDPSYEGSNNHDHGLYIRGDNTTIINNIFYDHPVGYHMQIGSNSQNISVINNTFGASIPYLSTLNGHIRVWGYTPNLSIQNNIFYNSPAYTLQCSEGMVGALYFKNNLTSSGVSLYPSACSTFTITSTDNIVGQDPLFTDAANRIYTLQSNSPAINAGLSNNAPAYDFLGIARPQGSSYDIGAYEYGNPADVNGDGHVNIKDIQACIKVITRSDLTYENQCSILAPPDATTNIKDIQVVIWEIIGG